LRVFAIAPNVLFAAWVFAASTVWGPKDYVGGAVAAIPPLVAVAALCAIRPGKVL
jgi:hypothetical protein